MCLFTDLSSVKMQEVESDEDARDFDVMNLGSTGENLKNLNFLMPVNSRRLQTKTSKNIQPTKTKNHHHTTMNTFASG